MRKSIFFLLLVCNMVFWASFGSVAWGWGWGLLLKPGDHVIDYTRLRNSAKVTAEAINNALQTLQLYENRKTGLKPTQEQDNVIKTVNEIRDAGQQLQLAGPLKQSAAWSAFEDPTDENLSASATVEQRQRMRTVVEAANYDTAGLIRLQNNNVRQIGIGINRLAAADEEGILGQRQVGNLQRALLLQLMMDNLYAEAAAGIATAANTQKEIAAEKISIRQQRDLRVKAYDPWNRTAADDEYYPVKDGVGFPKIGK